MRMTVILFLVLYSCATSKLEYDSQNTDLCVQAIDSLTYDASYIIHLKDNRLGRELKLLSLKGLSSECDAKLEVGNCYKLQTTLLSSTSGFTDIGHRLGKYNIYVDGRLIFAIEDYIVRSNQVRGLCFFSKGTD